MRPIRTAVVGVGHQGRWHAEKFAALENSELLVVVDIDGDRRHQIATDLGVASTASFEDIIGKVDAACIATPTSTHFEIASALLENGIHVLMEKPVTSTVDQASRLVALADANGLVLQVGHLERFNPAVVAMSSYIDNPQFIESHRIAPYKPRGLDVSVVLDLMIHDIDLIHSVVQSPTVQVDAIGRSVFSENIDVANARIRFGNGCIADVTSSRISLKTERTLRVFQEDAYLSVDMHNKKTTVYRSKHDGPVTGPDDVAIDKQSFENGDALLDQSVAFLESIAGGPRPLVSGRTALEALKTANAINDIVIGE